MSGAGKLRHGVRKSLHTLVILKLFGRNHTHAFESNKKETKSKDSDLNAN